MKKIKYVVLGIVTAVVTIFSFSNVAKACETCEPEYINVLDIVAVDVTGWGTYFYFADGTGYWLEGITSPEGITSLERITNLNY